MKDIALIVDLDNTIFETKSMDREVLRPFFIDFITNLKKRFNDDTIHLIEKDLWIMPWNQVAEKYQIPAEEFTNAAKKLKGIDDQLNIKPYDDYEYLKNLPYRKFLVTTSLVDLQESKIKALKIADDFIKVVINDPFTGKGKKVCFEELINEYKLEPEKTIVIGDDPDSEIKAGNELGLLTVQVLRGKMQNSNTAKYCIKSFGELEKILNNHFDKK